MFLSSSVVEIGTILLPEDFVLAVRFYFSKKVPSLQEATLLRW
jgi:hypothetical protein